jgi:hypothetical protein
MSTIISLEELLGIKNNCKIYFGCTGIDCFHESIASSSGMTMGV